MNNLSLFLYFADVLPQFAVLFFSIGVTAVILLGFYALFSGLSMDVYSWTTKEEKKAKKDRLNHATKIAPRRVLPIALGLMVVSVFIPSKQTIYLMAGSEAGEAVVASEEGREIIDDIKKIIRRQLDDLKKETTNL